MEDKNGNVRVALTVPPSIPARNNSTPPPIPVRKEDAVPMIPVAITAPKEGVPPPIPVRHDAETAIPNVEVKRPRIPNYSPRRRPAGAVATVMVSGEELRDQPSTRLHGQQQLEDNSATEELLARNPYDLKVAVGSTVTASYPFHGEESLQQLSFAVSPMLVYCLPRRQILQSKI